MLDILLRAGSFVTIILLGFLLRKIGFFQREDFSLLSKITIRVTLPCAIITSFSLVFFFLLPFALEVRQALVILVFSPISSAIPGFTQELKGDVGLSSALNSLTMVISIVIIVILLLVML